MPQEKDLWADIYYKGTEPASMRGREREEVGEFFTVSAVALTVVAGASFLVLR